MFPNVSGVGWGRVADKRLRYDPDLDDAVLLSSNRSVPYLKPFLHPPELKYADLYCPTQLVSTQANMTSGIVSFAGGLTAFAPLIGDTYDTRNGNNCIVKSWNVRGSIQLTNSIEAAQPPFGVLAFIALVRDKQTNGAQCTSEQIFSNPSNSKDTMHNPFRNALSSHRFEVLRHEVFDLSPKAVWPLEVPLPDIYGSSGISVPFDFFVPLDMKVHFKNSSSGLIDVVIDNSLHVVAFTSLLAPLLSPVVYIGLNSRVRFISA